MTDCRPADRWGSVKDHGNCSSRLVKRHCWGESLVVIFCAGPCNVNPRRVLTAAVPPGQVGLVGQVRWEQSKPIRIAGLTLWKFWSGRPAMCLYLLLEYLGWVCVCFAKPRLLAVNALRILKTLRGLSIEDTVKVTRLHASLAWQWVVLIPLAVPLCILDVCVHHSVSTRNV